MSSCPLVLWPSPSEDSRLQRPRDYGLMLLLMRRDPCVCVALLRGVRSPLMSLWMA